MDKDGNHVQFENEDIFGGCVSKHHIDGVIVKNHDNVCYVNNIKCYASESRFGGIIIMPYPN